VGPSGATGRDGSGDEDTWRDLQALPKAHLHLHFTGSMRHATLVELAARDGIVLPDALVEQWPPQLSAADEKGWFRFQRLYDVARSVLRTEDDVRRLVREAAEDDHRDGGRSGGVTRTCRIWFPRINDVADVALQATGSERAGSPRRERPSGREALASSRA
jgi:hypothetical protein